MKNYIDLGNSEQRLEEYKKYLEFIKQEIAKISSVPKALLDDKKNKKYTYNLKL